MLKASLIFHILKTVFISLPTNIVDSGLDINLGVLYLYSKNITRTTCIYINNSTATQCTADIPEVDYAWGIITLILVQWPMVVLVMWILIQELNKKTYRNAACSLLLLFIPFPIVVFVIQLTFLFSPGDSSRQFWAVMLLGLEAFAEASPQSGVQGYILLTDAEREFDGTIYLTLASSVVTVSKGAAELFTARAGDEDTTDELPLTDGDMAWYKKLYISFVKFLPTFISSYLFRGGSTVLIFAFFRQFAIIHLFLGVLLVTIMTTTFSETGVMGSVFHGLAGVMILPKFPGSTRSSEKKPMLYSTIIWLMLNTTTLLKILWMIVLGPDSGYWMPHWHNFNKFNILEDGWSVYLVIGGVLMFGPISLAIFYYQIYNVDWEMVNEETKKRVEKQNWDDREAVEMNPLNTVNV